MSVPVAQVASFLQSLWSQHARVLPYPNTQKILTFTGTTSRPGSVPALAVNALKRLSHDAKSKEVLVQLGGALPKPVYQNEWVSLCMADLPKFRGYQVKTSALAVAGTEKMIAESNAEGTLVRGRLVYTIHHSPNSMNLFEKIPFEELEKDLAGQKFALVAVGEQANLSPRFVFHAEAAGGVVRLFHGDGMPKKTYLNLQQNRREARLVLDLEKLSGFVFHGECRELPEGHAAVAEVQRGFEAGGWGKPLRCYEFSATRWEPVDLAT